jgi:hypothetical protein
MQAANMNNIVSFGSYNLVELIGKGAFGTVYLVKKGENKYALKHIPYSNLDVKEKEA